MPIHSVISLVEIAGNYVQTSLLIDAMRYPNDRGPISLREIDFHLGFQSNTNNRRVMFTLTNESDKSLREILRGFPSISVQQVLILFDSVNRMIGRKMSFKLDDYE